MSDSALDLLREQHRSATAAFHLQRVLHDLANHFHAIELRASYLDVEKRCGGEDQVVIQDILKSCATAREHVRSVIPSAPPAIEALACVPEVVLRAAALAVRDGCAVSVAPEVSSLPPARGDERELAVVLVHLFDNAREAGGRVHVSGAADDRELTLTVRDDGTGIPVDLAERIWKPFFTTKGSAHHGHGLALAKQAMRRCGGEIRLEPGPRTCFVLRLERRLHSP
jgi:signal transduction histidine kinase